MEYEIYRKLRDLENLKTHIIIIKPADCNMESLKILGEQLKEKYQSVDIAAVFVFDDKKAADLFRDTDPDYLPNFFSFHFVASYNRNVNTGLNRFFIHLPKEEGGELEIMF